MVKDNRPWQWKLLDQKFVYVVKAIPLAATIFWELNFMSYTWHMLNFAKKLGFKTKYLKINLVKKPSKSEPIKH